MTARIAWATIAFALLTTMVVAQPAPQPPKSTPAPKPGPQSAAPPAASQPETPAAVPPAPRREGQSVNVKVDVTITEQRAGAPAVKKTISVLTADEALGRVRSTEVLPRGAGAFTTMERYPLNIDISPRILAGGKIRLNIGLQYDLPVFQGAAEVAPNSGMNTIQETLNVILENGKPLIVAQSADPVSDRQVTVEVRATILK